MEKSNEESAEGARLNTSDVKRMKETYANAMEVMPGIHN